MSVPAVPLAGVKKNALHKAVSNPPLSPNFAATGQTNPHLRVFVAHFDGTQNDYKAVPKAFQETLVASSFHSITDSLALASRYYHGVGTRTDGFLGLVESAFGLGCEDRAEQAYAELAEATRAWRLEDPDAQVHVHVVGFSRGAAIGLHFMNLVHERGIASPKSVLLPRLRLPQSDAVAPGEVKMSAVLLDTVATGQGDVLKLGLPPSAVSVLHLTAGGEQRFLFPLTSLTDSGRPSEIAQAVGVSMPAVADAPEPLVSADATRAPITYRRLHQVMLAGACHSDVGGSYRDGGLRDVSGYLMKEFQRSLGLPVTVTRPTFEHVQTAFAHDSRFLIDKLTPKRDYRRGMRRPIEDAEVTHWDGRLTESVVVESRLKGERQRSESLRIIDPASPEAEGGPAYSREQLGREYKLTVRLADPAKGERGKMAFDSSPPGVFGRHSSTRRFTFFGKPLQSAPTADAIIGRLEAGEKAFVLKVRLEKALPVFEAAAGATAGPAAPPAAPDSAAEHPDPWPKEIRDAIVRMNTAPKKMAQADADKMMVACLESAARALHGHAGAQVVEVRPAPGAGRGIALSCPGAHSRAPATDSVRSLERALRCLARLMEAQGLDPYVSCTRRIELTAAGAVIPAEFLRTGELTPGSNRGAKSEDVAFEDESLWSRIKSQRSDGALQAIAAPALRPSLLGGLGSEAPAPPSVKDRPAKSAARVDRTPRM